MRLWKRTIRASGSRASRGAGRRELGLRRARSCSAIRRPLPFAAASTVCSSTPPANSATLRPVAQHDDAVAKADQLGHLARGDENAEALRGELAQPRIDLALGADVDAARRLVEKEEPRVRRGPPWPARPSAGCRRTGRPTGDVGIARPDVELAERRASPPRPPAPPDMKPSGEMRAEHRHDEVAADRHAQHQAAAAPVVGDEGDAGLARRADRVEPDRLAVDLDRRRSSGRRGRCRRARSAARCGRRP